MKFLTLIALLCISSRALALDLYQMLPSEKQQGSYQCVRVHRPGSRLTATEFLAARAKENGSRYSSKKADCGTLHWIATYKAEKLENLASITESLNACKCFAFEMIDISLKNGEIELVNKTK
jgi:hypothetical protein